MHKRLDTREVLVAKIVSFLVITTKQVTMQHLAFHKKLHFNLVLLGKFKALDVGFFLLRENKYTFESKNLENTAEGLFGKVCRNFIASRGPF